MDVGPAPAISRLGINPYQWGTECLSGDVSAGAATAFPMAINMVHRIICLDQIQYFLFSKQAATFNYDIVYTVASAIGDEVRAKVSAEIIHQKCTQSGN